MASVDKVLLKRSGHIHAHLRMCFLENGVVRRDHESTEMIHVHLTVLRRRVLVVNVQAPFFCPVNLAIHQKPIKHSDCLEIPPHTFWVPYTKLLNSSNVITDGFVFDSDAKISLISGRKRSTPCSLSKAGKLMDPILLIFAFFANSDVVSMLISFLRNHYIALTLKALLTSLLLNLIFRFRKRSVTSSKSSFPSFLVSSRCHCLRNQLVMLVCSLDGSSSLFC